MANNNPNPNQNPVRVEQFLRGIKFPANKQAIVQQAQRNKADQSVIDLLNSMPDQQYNSPADVAKAVSQAR